MEIEPIEMDFGNSPPEQENNNKVQVSGEDKQQIYYPWRFSLIIKLQEKKKILRQVLKRKPSEAFPLVDLGEGYYTVKFNKE